MHRRELLLAFAGLAVTSTGALARKASKVDFRTADLMGGGFALMTSQLALGKTSNPDILNFANEEIAEQVQVATALGATPGSAPLRPDKAVLYARLQGTPSGSGFDAMYVQGQLGGHRELLALNTNYLRTGSIPDEQAVAQMSLPIIQRHLSILSGLRNLG